MIRSFATREGKMWLSIDDPDGIERRYSARPARFEFAKENSLAIYSNEDECFFPCKFYPGLDGVTPPPVDKGLTIEREEADNVQFHTAKAK